MKTLGRDPKRKGAELTQLRALHRRVEKDKDAYELAFALERDQLLFNEFRRASNLMDKIERAIQNREEDRR